MDRAEYVFQRPRESEEFILHRGLANQAEEGSVPVLVSVSPPTRFLRLPLVWQLTLRWLRELIPKDLKPSNVLADSANGGDWITGLSHRGQKEG